MKKLLATAALATVSFCTLAASPHPAAAAAVSPAERTDILELINTTGALDIGMHVGSALADQLIGNIKRLHPEISDVAIRDIKQACADILNRPSTRAKLVDASVRIYAKYYTDADIRGMIRFYRTPLGKKIIRNAPKVSQEGMLAGESVVRPLQGELIDLIRQYLRRDHIDPRTLKPEKSE